MKRIYDNALPIFFCDTSCREPSLCEGMCHGRMGDRCDGRTTCTPKVENVIKLEHTFLLFQGRILYWVTCI